MSASSQIERFCDVLDGVALNSPTTSAVVEAQTGIPRRTVCKYLKAFEAAGFVEPSGENRDRTYSVGDRLRLIVDNVKGTP